MSLTGLKELAVHYRTAVEVATQYLFIQLTYRNNFETILDEIIAEIERRQSNSKFSFVSQSFLADQSSFAGGGFITEVADVEMADSSSKDEVKDPKADPEMPELVPVDNTASEAPVPHENSSLVTKDTVFGEVKVLGVPLGNATPPVVPEVQVA